MHRASAHANLRSSDNGTFDLVFNNQRKSSSLTNSRNIEYVSPPLVKHQCTTLVSSRSGITLSSPLVSQAQVLPARPTVLPSAWTNKQLQHGGMQGRHGRLSTNELFPVASVPIRSILLWYPFILRSTHSLHKKQQLRPPMSSIAISNTRLIRRPPTIWYSSWAISMHASVNNNIKPHPVSLGPMPLTTSTRTVSVLWISVHTMISALQTPFFSIKPSIKPAGCIRATRNGICWIIHSSTASFDQVLKMYVFFAAAQERLELITTFFEQSWNSILRVGGRKTPPVGDAV